MSILNNKQFSTKLNGVIRSAKSQRDTIQQLIISGLEQYKDHRNTGQLTRLIQATYEVKSLPTRVIKEFVKAHANVQFTQNKEKEFVFKALSKETEVTIPEVTWYNWEGNENANVKPDMDVIAQAKSFYTRITKALNEGKVKDKDKAEALQNTLAEYLEA